MSVLSRHAVDEDDEDESDDDESEPLSLLLLELLDPPLLLPPPRHELASAGFAATARTAAINAARIIAPPEA